MASLKTIGNNIFSRLLIFTLISSFLFFLFDTYQESYDKLKVLQNTIDDRNEEIFLMQNQIDDWNQQILDLEDPEGMKKEAIKARELGFSGKGSIHPNQVPILNEVFTPPQDEIIKAKKILEEFNNSNTGLVVIDGKLIEKPVLREMKRKILIADKINKV